MVTQIPIRDVVKLQMEKLTERAEELARSYGHSLSWQDIAFGPDKATTLRDGRCTLCDSPVRISANPESGIEGDAVSTACPGES